MTVKSLIIIVAMTPSGLIGNNGKIPWHIPEDMRRFKKLTTGHAIIMGRKTYNSIGKPLPNRMNIVLSRDMTKTSQLNGSVADLDVTATIYARTFNESLAHAYRHDESPFVIGGAEIYQLAEPLATRLEVTYFIPEDEEAYGDGDVYFRWSGRRGWSGYPDLRKWRCTNIERAKEPVPVKAEVEFHTFERRLR